MSAEALTGSSPRARQTATDPALLDGVRAALTGYGHLAAEPPHLPPFAQLRTTVVETYRLDQATRLATRLGADANHGFTAFGPTNVALHRVSTAARMGDPLRVLSDAATVNTDGFPVALNGRRAQLHLDVAAAQSQRRHDPEAVYHLREAERIASELLRYYVGAHTLLSELLRRERRGQTPALRPLAARAGVL